MVLQLTEPTRGKRSRDWPPGPGRWVAQGWELELLVQEWAVPKQMLCFGFVESCALLWTSVEELPCTSRQVLWTGNLKTARPQSEQDPDFEGKSW